MAMPMHDIRSTPVNGVYLKVKYFSIIFSFYDLAWVWMRSFDIVVFNSLIKTLCQVPCASEQAYIT